MTTASEENPAERPLSVIVWATGDVGTRAIRAIVDRPDLELVGAWVHSDTKDGRDAGELAGIADTGVRATNDVDQLLSLGADCVCFAASDGLGGETFIDDYERILLSGANCLTTATPGLLFPPAYDQPVVERLEAAATHGGSTLYASGIEPGFAADQLVLTATTLSRTIRSICAREVFLYDKMPVAFTMFDVFGFGHDLDYVPLITTPGVQTATWGPVVRMIAAGLGVELDGIRETFERDLADRRIEVAAGTIEPGTVGTVRMATIGVVDDRDVIVVEHVSRMAPDLAPHWPTTARDGTYQIQIDGAPSISCELVLGEDDSQASDAGMEATTMRVVNAIPAVCAAPMGLTSSLDLPLTLPRHAIARAGG